MSTIRRPSRPPPWSVHLDPAKRRCGVAVFREDRLFSAATLRSPNPAALHRVILDWVWAHTGQPLPDLVWVAEIPMVYERDRAARQNLTALVDLVDAIEREATEIVRVTPPSQWKGNLTKGATIYRVGKRLHNIERGSMFDTDEDTFDAVGLGLWFVRRVNRGLTLPGR